MSVKIEGLRELLANLSKKEDEIKRATRQANLAAGDIILEELKRNVPKRYGTLHNAATKSGNRTDGATAENYVAVGFNKSANWYSHIPEFGSIDQSPKGYMSKTVQATEGKVVKEMEQTIKRVLG